MGHLQLAGSGRWWYLEVCRNTSPRLESKAVEAHCRGTRAVRYFGDSQNLVAIAGWVLYNGRVTTPMDLASTPDACDGPNPGGSLFYGITSPSFFARAAANVST